MKKLYLIIISLLLPIVSLFGFNKYIQNYIMDNSNKLIYHNADIRNSNDLIMDNIITKDSIVVLGSSELSSSDNIAYPIELYNYGYSNFNQILIGRGYNQSLFHSITIGSLQNNIKNNKVVLILSPQWFTESHLRPDIFSSVFVESNYIEFLKNKNISKSLKAQIANRLDSLLIGDLKTKERMDLYESIYLYRDNLNLFNYLEIKVLDLFSKLKSNFELFKQVKIMEDYADYNNYVDATKINYKSLLEEAERTGKSSCTNNNFGINDNYYDTYVKYSVESRKDSSVNESYTTSIEYDDLRLFLEICKDLEIEPLIISVPVNGRWYDYTGFPKEDREEYYNNIRELCKEFDVDLADFSDKEYEKYFLKDVMHLGWKGWVYLDEAIYNFYKK